jgi:hypothetical protein
MALRFRPVKDHGPALGPGLACCRPTFPIRYLLNARHDRQEVGDREAGAYPRSARHRMRQLSRAHPHRHRGARPAGGGTSLETLPPRPRASGEPARHGRVTPDRITAIRAVPRPRVVALRVEGSTHRIWLCRLVAVIPGPGAGHVAVITKESDQASIVLPWASEPRSRLAPDTAIARSNGRSAMGDPGLEPGTSSLSEKRSNRLS